MEPTPQTVEPKSAVNPPDAQKLLESANSASEQVGVLHLGFIAACVYVIVIASGRTDLDLLIGKGIRLPIIDTEVPIVGFFAAAPWILVIAHFNLLLHLQLLARKLNAFDQADIEDKLRDQLRIFPITWFLAGKTDERTRKLLSLMASITVILLPLITLLILQLQFLAYQSEIITWGQRFAIWLDLVLLVYFWPIIVELEGASTSVSERWNNFHQQNLPRIQDWIAPALTGIGLMLVFCGTEWYIVLTGLITVYFFSSIRKIAYVLICFFLPLALQVDGEYLEQVITTFEFTHEKSTLISASFLKEKRILNLKEKRLFANHPDPEIIAQLRSSDWSKALQKIEPLDLHGRNLRHANFIKALLCRAVFRNADLKGADLRFVQLQDADLSFAELQGADLSYAQLQGAKLFGAQLQGTFLRDTLLQGSFLHEVQLQGADLNDTDLMGAALDGAQLQGADLSGAQLQGASTFHANFQGANLHNANLYVADLFNANLYGADYLQNNLSMIDARALKWAPLNKDKQSDLIKTLSTVITEKEILEIILDGLQDASRPSASKPMLQSCLATDQLPLPCKNRYDPSNPKELNAFRQQLHPILANLAAESPDIARGIIRQIPNYDYYDYRNAKYAKESSRFGLASVLVKRLDAGNAPGLQALSDKEKAHLRELAKKEQELLKK